GSGEEAGADAARQHARIADALTGDRLEGLDHAGYGAEQAEKRRDGGDRAERAEEAFELVHDVPAGVLDRLLHDLPALVAVGESRGEHAPERRVVRERLDVALVEGLRLDQLPDALGELARD